MRYLVVDLRANAGGDFTLFVEIAKWLRNKIADDGHLYVIVSPKTYSATINSTGLLIYYGDGRTMIVGASMRDREQYWGNMACVSSYPTSGLKFSMQPATKIGITYTATHSSRNMMLQLVV